MPLFCERATVSPNCTCLGHIRPGKPLSSGGEECPTLGMAARGRLLLEGRETGTQQMKNANPKRDANVGAGPEFVERP
jgi:hypothetical protein